MILKPLKDNSNDSKAIEEKLPCFLPRDTSMNDLQGFRCWAVGWGQTEQWTDGTESFSTYLKSAGVSFMKRDYCLTHSNYEDANLDSNHFCAAKKPADDEILTAEGGAGCKGDDGGPLICDVFGQATLVGIQDGYDAENCGKKGYPNKYLDLSTVHVVTRKLGNRDQARFLETNSRTEQLGLVPRIFFWILFAECSLGDTLDIFRSYQIDRPLSIVINKFENDR